MHSLCSHTCTIEVKFPRYTPPEILILFYSASAEAQLCEAFILFLTFLDLFFMICKKEVGLWTSE